MSVLFMSVNQIWGITRTNHNNENRHSIPTGMTNQLVSLTIDQLGQRHIIKFLVVSWEVVPNRDQ